MEKYVTKRQLVVIILFLIIFVVGLNMKESYSEKEVIDEKVFLYDQLLKNNTIIEEEITKDKSINYSIDDVGLYKENNYYFFRGNVENNYIKINDEMWRIVAILENKNIRIIKEDGINSNQLYKYNDDYSNYSYSYSVIYNELDTWYKDNLIDYDEYITEEEYCVEYENGCLLIDTMKIGLLNEMDVIYAGGYRNSINDSFYLQNDNNWWIIAKEYDDFIGSAFSGYVNNLGSIEMGFVDEEMTIRPVIHLKGDSSIIGEGTIDSPYEIEK